MGIDEYVYCLGLMSPLAGSLSPDGEAGRRAQVKREIPGMRGRTKNQRIKNRMKTNIPSINSMIHPYGYRPLQEIEAPECGRTLIKAPARVIPKS